MRSASSGSRTQLTRSAASAGRARAIQNEVAIAARERAVARVKGVGDFARPQHADLRRQIRGRARAPSRARVRIGVRIEVHDLHGGVHAGIGAAGGHDFDGMIGDGGQRRFDDRLDADARAPATASRRKALPSYSRPRAMRA